MIYQVLDLGEQFPQLAEGFCDNKPTLTSYIIENSNEIDIDRKRPAILICPGGGYSFTSFREAEPVALAFLAKGYSAFALHYSCAPSRYPQQLLEASAAMSYIRENAQRFNIDENKILVCGFSAGGHLAASLATFWNEDFINEKLGIKKGANKPNGLILSYPVITSGEFAHRNSFENLLGDNYDELVSKMSLENQVNPLVPPTFLWHTRDDSTVPVENAMLFSMALRKQNIEFDMHIFNSGYHGLSLSTEITSAKKEWVNDEVSVWFEQCVHWIKKIF